MSKNKNLEEVKALKTNITEYIKENPAKATNSGFVTYRPLLKKEKDIFVVSIMGRGATPSSDTDTGMHWIAAHAAMNGCASIVVSAHDSNRAIALKTLQKLSSTTKVYIYGHSHGGDHASLLAKEYKSKTKRQVAALITLDPVDSPTPFPLTSVADKTAMEKHINYYQRNAPWYGGNISTATVNTNVSDGSIYRAWSSILLSNNKNKNTRINHTTIDEDLFLGGYLWWPWLKN